MRSRRIFTPVSVATGLVVLLALVVSMQSQNERPPYLDPNQPIEKRVEDLLGRMTLSEKIGQMNMLCVYEDGLGLDEKSKFAALPI